jgi:hypothetical protein
MSKLKNDELLSWWRNWWFEITLSAAFAIVIVGMLIATYLSTQHNNDTRTNAPCAYFASTDIENVPARCYHYFSIATPVGKLR